MCKCSREGGTIRVDDSGEYAELVIFDERLKALISVPIDFCPYCSTNLQPERPNPEASKEDAMA